MKIISVNCGLRIEYGSDLRSYEHYLNNMGYEPMTSAIPVQRFTK